MDGSRPGEAGVLAWCNTIRFNMAQDPGRQILHDQIQTQGFDFLDSYLENFFEGPKNEPVIELLKTPGRKKNAPARTRAGTAAAEKARAVTSLSFEDSDLKENQEPVNEFQRALLRAKEKADEESARQTVPAQQTTVERPLKQHPFFAKLKSQKIVTIADSPVADTPGRSIHAMDLDRDAEPIPAVVFDREPGLMDHATTSSQQVDAHPHESCESIKELSMIAEDDEPAERSRVSFKTATSPNSLARSPPVETARSSPVQETFHDAPRGPEPLASETAQTEVPEDAYSARVSEPSAEDLTTASANTFHSIPLDSPRNRELNPPGFRADDSHTAPLPKLSLPPVPLEEDPHAHTAPLPSSSSLHEEYTVPLREEPSVPVPGLSRKTSVSQFSGLPAPSPLRKSLRVPGDPAVANPAGTAGLPGGKRTSWLSKARETKAMESTVKRSNTLTHGLGFGALTANKRKSGEMLDSGKDLPAIPNATLKPVDEEQRVAKHPKLAGASADDNFDVNSEAKAASPEVDMGVGPQAENDAPAKTVNHAASPAIGDAMNREEDGLLGLFKKPIDSAARMTKGAGKSLGGNAAAALAEARARAEARVAERHKLELGLMTDSEDVSMTAEEKPESTDGLPAQPEESERRLSLSDLVSASHDDKGKGPVITRQSTQILDADTSTSTTPPHSPPPQSRNTSFVAPSGPVFTKPPAPFGPRPPTSTRLDPAAPSMGRDFSFKLASNPFSIPAAMTLGMGSNKIVPLSAQSSKGSVFSDIVFDTKNASPQPAWMPSTQDTSYSAGGSQSQHASKFGNPAEADNDDLDDDDDSWGVDEKFAAHQTWTPFGFSTGDPGTGDEQIMKDDTMTWTTYPSHSTSTSQRGGDTGPVQPTQNFFSSLPQSKEKDEDHAVVDEMGPLEGFAEGLAAAAQQPSDEDEGVNEEADMAMEVDDVEDDEQGDVKGDLEDAILSDRPTVTLVQQSKTDPAGQTRSESQQSMASTASSSQQSQLGFFGQATRLVSSVLGGSKKGKPEVKSLQLAAAAAKKQQEELEKKAARLKEMENRRQLAMQRKAEEEKSRALEEERKIKEEAERRKREREEHTDKRPLRSTTATTKKADEDNTKKREIPTKTASKPPSKDKKDSAVPRTVKPPPVPAAASSSKTSTIPKSALKQPAAPTVPATPGGSKSTTTGKTLKSAPSSSNLRSTAGTSKGKGPTTEPSEQPPTAKGKMAPPATRSGPPAEPPVVASEDIELPDINSEYSDSEDEDRPRRELPDWAQSPDIAAALQQQSTINPDDIFGRIGPLRMEEIFRTRQSRFRARTSSANWTGTDELTAEEEREYARRMGFR